jgi:hypothetical protein
MVNKQINTMERGVSDRHYMHIKKTEIFSGPKCLQAVSALPSGKGSFKTMSSTGKYKGEVLGIVEL